MRGTVDEDTVIIDFFQRIDLPKKNRTLEVNKDNEPMPFEVAVKKTADPDWYYLKATVLQKNGQVDGNELSRTDFPFSDLVRGRDGS